MLASCAPSTASGKNASWTHLVFGISHRSLAFLSMKPQSTFFCPHLPVCVVHAYKSALTKTAVIGPRLLTWQFGLKIYTKIFFFQIRLHLQVPEVKVST